MVTLKDGSNCYSYNRGDLRPFKKLTPSITEHLDKIQNNINFVKSKHFKNQSHLGLGAGTGYQHPAPEACLIVSRLAMCTGGNSIKTNAVLLR